MTRKTFSDETVLAIIPCCTSIKQVLQKVGMAPCGGNYATIRRIITRYGVDTSHFCKGFTVGHLSSNKLSDEGIFIINSKANRHRVKARILAESLLPYECAICGIDSWIGSSLSLHLDHINGIRDDNRLENLRFLCPNCHSQTDSYCGKANKKCQTTICECGTVISSRSTRCRSCEKVYSLRVSRGSKIEWPSVEELLKRLETTSWCGLARELGVSDNAIRQHLRRRHR